MGVLILEGGELKISSHLRVSTIFFLLKRRSPSLKCVTAPPIFTSLFLFVFKRPQMSNEREILDPTVDPTPQCGDSNGGLDRHRRSLFAV